MDLVIQAAVLGMVQGLSEFLPISSSWHLIVVPKLLGWDDPFINSAGFDVMLHMGTLVALLVYFWADLWRYLGAFLRSLAERRIGPDPDRRLAWLLVITIVPAAILGALGESFFDTFFREHSAAFLVVLMLIGAAVLWLANRIGTMSRGLGDMHVRDAVVIGASQALALFPGMSRSGVTISAGLYLGLTREAAARFSFLMAVPVIAGAGLWKGRELLAGGVAAADLGPLAVGFLTSLVFGALSIVAMLAYLRRRSYNVFVFYRVAAAAVVVVWLLSH